MDNVENFTPYEILKLEKDEAIQKTALQAALTDSQKSALQKYQAFAIGSSSLSTLLKYEFLTGVFGPIPGALGLVLRKQFYKSLFGSVGRGVVFGKSITVRHPHKIHIGDNVVIDDYAVLDAKGINNQGIVIGNNVMIGRDSVISCKNGNITIGDNTNIAASCFIQSAKTVSIGKNVLLAPYSYVIGGGDHETIRIDIPIIAQGQICRGINVDDNCWIGANVKILDGVTIHRDTIVGAGSVVTKSMPEFSVVVGVPGKVIKDRRHSQFHK